MIGRDLQLEEYPWAQSAQSYLEVVCNLTRTCITRGPFYENEQNLASMKPLAFKNNLISPSHSSPKIYLGGRYGNFPCFQHMLPLAFPTPKERARTSLRTKEAQVINFSWNDDLRSTSNGIMLLHMLLQPKCANGCERAELVLSIQTPRLILRGVR